MHTGIRLLLLIRPFIFHFSFCPIFKHWNFSSHFSQVLWGLGPRRLKLSTHVDSGQMYHVYRNQAAAAYSSLYYTPPPPQNIVLGGYTVFSMSMIPKFRQHLRCLLYNFDSFCPILFKSPPHLDHQTVHVWQENRGWRISITRVMRLCNSYNKMFVLWLIVHSLWNQLLLELSLDLFNTLQICYRHTEDVHKEVWCWKNIFWQIDRGFNLSHFLTTAPRK